MAEKPKEEFLTEEQVKKADTCTHDYRVASQKWDSLTETFLTVYMVCRFCLDTKEVRF